MQVKLILNGYDAGPWIKEGGFTQTEIVRVSREVITLDGIKHRGEIIKRGLTIGFVEMRDVSWYKLTEALKTRPVAVEYIDDRLGERKMEFWASAPQATAKTVRGGITYFTGGTVTLEEV